MRTRHPFELIFNPSAMPDATYGSAQEEILSAEGLARAKEIICAWPGYAPTPLVALPGIAQATSVASVYYKDESRRCYGE